VYWGRIFLPSNRIRNNLLSVGGIARRFCVNRKAIPITRALAAKTYEIDDCVPMGPSLNALIIVQYREPQRLSDAIRCGLRRERGSCTLSNPLFERRGGGREKM